MAGVTSPSSPVKNSATTCSSPLENEMKIGKPSSSTPPLNYPAAQVSSSQPPPLLHLQQPPPPRKSRYEGISPLPPYSSVQVPRHDIKHSFADVIGSSPPTYLQSISSKTISKHKGYPAISFTPSEIKSLSAPYEFSLVGRFPKSRPPLPVLRQVLERIGFRNSYSVGVLAPSHVLLTFSNAEDYQRCFSKRIWQIQGFPMHVFKWGPEFHCDEESPIFPVWITLEHLPIHFHDPLALHAIAKIFGTPLMLDAATSSKTRPSAARFCVELDVTKELPAKFFLDNGGKGLWQQVTYEQLPQYCVDCHKSGHSSGDCAMGKTPIPLSKPTTTTPQTACRARWRKQHIHSILNKHDNLISKEIEILEAATHYYADLYSHHPTTNMEAILQHIPCTITEAQNTALCRLPSIEEVKNAVWLLDQNSCAGPDGFNGTFYRQTWDIIQADICSAIQESFLGIIPPKAMRKSNMVLIPKKDSPTTFSDFRPISLTNFSSKIITRILASRLTTLLPCIISLEQGGFVPGKDINDHILLARELIHLIDRKTEGGNLALKLDITKAFDTISWDYISQCLNRFGFNQKFTSLVMNSIQHSIISTLVNGTPSKPFNPRRGVRQGDPLSPYIFIIAMEGFTRSLNKLVSTGHLKGFNTGRIQTVNHLSYADDVLVFTNGSIHNLKKLKNFLSNFEESTGLHLNLTKIQIISPKPSSNHAKRQKDCLGMKLASLPVTYLGTPIYKGCKLWWKYHFTSSPWVSFLKQSYHRSGNFTTTLIDSPTWKRICQTNDFCVENSTLNHGSLEWNLGENGSFSLKEVTAKLLGPAPSLLTARIPWPKKCIPKASLFLWKTLNGATPFANNLDKLGYNLPSMCLLCKRDLETDLHCLMQCPKASYVAIQRLINI
ncbi:unnamed protein product [Cuscuta campestris]|uniref:Reverse transcriptase domain-containing protein n=1 Tax=Cuscuta campestris TaxID=132261 RepID=A0A484KJY5_9ASTE|nr:unnamed protein product [Cuscuta campestris]